MVSLRGSAAPGARGAFRGSRGDSRGRSSRGCSRRRAAVAGAAVAGAAVVAAAPQADKNMLAAIIMATRTYSCFFIIFFSLRICWLVEG